MLNGANGLVILGVRLVFPKSHPQCYGLGVEPPKDTQKTALTTLRYESRRTP